ncbi:FAD-dependent oxidoreductase [bacterium]|nr:MAG: FAD-dependent oxidoreductase [bacterium]
MKNYDVIIIGGGIIGSAIAYELAKLGITKTLVVEKNYFSSGSTGRCGAGVRQQWGLKFNALLAKKSVDIFENLSDELEMDIEFRQGGYLVLAHSDLQVEQFEKNVKLQNSLGIPSRFVSKEEARQICPPLNLNSFTAATYCPTDGHTNPFLANYAYLRAAQRLGVELKRYTEVVDIITEKDRIQGVVLDDGSKIYSPVVVNCAGPWSREVAQMAGVDIPTHSERHQILVTEPVEPMFDTMVISFQIGIYVQQVPHGSFVMGIGEKEEPSHDIRSTWQFLEYITHHLLNILPIMSKVRVVRQWAGSYNKTPDAAPILGEHPQVKGFYQAVGFSGHGFMLAPMTGRVMAQQIKGIPPEIDVSPLSVERFEKGELIIEPSVVG